MRCGQCNSLAVFLLPRHAWTVERRPAHALPLESENNIHSPLIYAVWRHTASDTGLTQQVETEQQCHPHPPCCRKNRPVGVGYAILASKIELHVPVNLSLNVVQTYTCGRFVKDFSSRATSCASTQSALLFHYFCPSVRPWEKQKMQNCRKLSTKYNKKTSLF